MKEKVTKSEKYSHSVPGLQIRGVKGYFSIDVLEFSIEN